MKKKVLILCGGKSDEHEISLISAKHVLDALDREKFVPQVVGISKEGQWHLEDEKNFLIGEIRADQVKLNTKAPTVTLEPHANDQNRAVLHSGETHIECDVVFPVLHGHFGEDGTLQGMLELLEVPFVGAGSGSSWICMDKIFSKMLCRQNDFPTADFVALAHPEELEQKQAQVDRLQYPLFVKPNRQGSSVGISRVQNPSELKAAVALAFQFDQRVLIETGIDGREIECAVLGPNRKAQVAPPGEIVPAESIGFYSYEGKYLLDDGAALHVPAQLSPEETQRVQQFALRVFDTLECDGMARVDLFLERGSGKVFLNEVNTIPGFTPISMYPKLWAAGGINYSDLITRLLDLAFQRQR